MTLPKKVEYLANGIDITNVLAYGSQGMANTISNARVNVIFNANSIGEYTVNCMTIVQLPMT